MGDRVASSGGKASGLAGATYQMRFLDKLVLNSSCYAALTQSKPVTLAEIQQQVLDDTLHLQYSLGEERSYLWAVTKTSLTSYELLPARVMVSLWSVDDEGTSEVMSRFDKKTPSIVPLRVVNA
jgi:hypothetical protein